MNYKNIFKITAVGALSLMLAACGTTPKEEYIEVTSKTSDAESFSSESTFKFHVDVKGSEVDEFEKEQIDFINNAKLKIDTNVDKKRSKTEFIVKATVQGMSVEVPVLIDEKENKVYLKGDAFFAIFPAARAQFGKENVGKVMELDVAVINEQLPEEEKIVLGTPEANEKLEKALNAEIDKFYENKKEEDFVKSDSGVTATFKLEELTTLFKEVSSVIVAHQADENAKVQMEQAVNQVILALPELSEVITVKNISHTITKSKDGAIESSKTVFELVFKDDVVKKDYHMKITSDTTFSNVNKKIDFRINPKVDPIITTEELIKLLGESTDTTEYEME